jgi:hypothetical protein
MYAKFHKLTATVTSVYCVVLGSVIDTSWLKDCEAEMGVLESTLTYQSSQTTQCLSSTRATQSG